MSLIVYPYLRNQKEDSLIELEDAIDANQNDLFGFENWRWKVWGATIIREMGCEILPALSKMDIYAEQEGLNQLEQELLMILNEIEQLSDKLQVDKTSLEFRVKNALAAIRVAKGYENGGVYIG